MSDADVTPRAALLEPGRDQIEIFVDALFRHAGSEGYVSVRSFLANNEVFRISTAPLKGGLRHLIEVSVDDARRAANAIKPVTFCPPIAVFDSADGWRARQEDLLKGLALSVEVDENPDEALSRLEEILGPVTLIVKSGGWWIDPDDRPRDKLHLHWRLSRPAMGDQLAKLKQARRLAAASVGADTSNVPTVHCLRWPGSWHRKSAPRLCEIAMAEPDVEIDLDEALERLEAVAPKPAEGKGHDSSEARPEEWGEFTANIIAGTKLHEGSARLAAKYARSGTPIGAGIHQARALMEASAARNERPADWKDRFDDIPRAFDTAYAKFSEAASMPTGPPSTIDETLAVFEHWLILPSRTPVYAVLGAVAANYLPGDPVWLGLIAPPSSAKTEILNSVARLPEVVPAATITAAGLLSGTPRKDRAAAAKGGLLRQIGQFGIVAVKDFGSVLSMNTETRAELLAALREIYDGAWTRHLGADGGRTLHWQGKLGLIFASTTAIDSYYAVIGALGDRFLMSRMTPAPEGQFRRALKHDGVATAQMRKELAEAVARLFAGRRAEPRPLSDDEIDRIDRIISLVVRQRGVVERDRRTREMEMVLGAEGPARIGLCLSRLLAGLDTLGVERGLALDVVESVARDSVPPLRRAAFEHVESRGSVETAGVAVQLGLPTTTVRRVLEDLAAYGLIERQSGGKGTADLWLKRL